MGSSPTDSWIYNLKPKIIIFYGFWPKNCTSFSYFKEVSSHVPMGIFQKNFREAFKKKKEYKLGNCPKRWEGVNLKTLFFYS